MSVFAIAPFLGPVLGPIGGNFFGEAEGWRWLQGLMALFSGFIWLVGCLIGPETYPPVLLRRRAAALSKRTGKVYISKGDLDQGKTSFGEVFSASLARPWVLLFTEPIVLMLSIYMAIIYGTCEFSSSDRSKSHANGELVYMLFGAYPIVYQQGRHWSGGVGSLAFVGVAIGMFLSLGYTIVFDNKRYARVVKKSGGFAPPEARLPQACIGAVALPIGLFWFAWTNSPSTHYLVSMAAGIPFGFAMVLVFLSVTNYLIDSYTIFAASVLAANSVLRSLFGAAFPLFTKQMYQNLGIHWASTIPAFLALACLPFPFLFYKYGASIRERCKFAAEADAFMKKLRGQMPVPPATAVSHPESSDSSVANEAGVLPKEKEEEAEQEAFDYSYKAEQPEPTFERIRSRAAEPPKDYEHDPYTLDRVNTRESFKKRGGEGILAKIRSRQA